MMTDSTADILTRIRNSQRAGQATVRVRSAKFTEKVLGVLAREGFIQGFERVTAEDGRSELEVRLKYYASHEPVISSLERVSKPGRRVYTGYQNLPKVAQGLGILVLSTSQGVMSDREARRKKLGGEVVARVS